MARKNPPSASLDPLEAAKAPAENAVPSSALPSIASLASARSQDSSDDDGLAPLVSDGPKGTQGNVGAPTASPDDGRGEPKLTVPSGGKLRRFEVQHRVTVSWGSQMITLHPGTIVSEASHGPGSMERMRDAGVALREVAD